MADRDWQTFSDTLAGLGPAARVAALGELTREERHDFFKSYWLRGVAGALDGSANDAAVLGALVTDEADLVALAAALDFGLLLAALGADDRRRAMTAIEQSPAAVRALAGNPHSDLLIGCTPDSWIEKILNDPAAESALAESTAADGMMPRAWDRGGPADATALLDVLMTSVPVRRAMAASNGLFMVIDHILPERVGPLITGFVTDAETRPAFATRFDAAELIAAQTADPRRHLWSLITDDRCVPGLAGNLAAVIAQLPERGANIRERAIALPAARKALARSKRLPEAVATAETDTARYRFLAALVRDPASRRELLDNEDLGIALETVVDLSLRAALIGPLERENDQTPRLRYTLARARGGRLPAPPEVAVAVALWWGDIVRMTRPEERDTAVIFEELLIDRITDALYARPHYTAFKRGYDVIEDALALTAMDAGYTFPGIERYRGKRPDHPLWDPVPDSGVRMQASAKTLIPEHTWCRVRWNEAWCGRDGGAVAVYTTPAGVARTQGGLTQL